jgi:predicted phosphate transport protein (TIGR00153 family)
MVLERILSLGKKERDVTEDMRRHIQLLCDACNMFKTALEKQDRNLMRKVVALEREGDSVRREVISHIYEGAFLPFLRPDLCKFVEVVDEVFDLLKDTVSCYLDAELPGALRSECVRVALLNFRMCEMLMISFEAMLKGQDLREKTLAIRIYEKKIDDMKFGIISEAQQIPVSDFWSGKKLSDLISGLTSISDIIEDASDHLQILNVSTR